MKKHFENIEKHYEEYLNQPLRVGFMDSFPIDNIIDTIEVSGKCRDFDVIFNVHLCYVNFGVEKFKSRAIITDEVIIRDKLKFAGSGSFSYIDESRTMEMGIVEMAKKHDFFICTKINSWPIAKAIISENIYKE
jgi:hypothetical protein